VAVCSVAVLILQLDYERDNPSASTFTVRRRRTREPPCFFFERVRARSACSLLLLPGSELTASRTQVTPQRLQSADAHVPGFDW
jgi:hypothetical protein